MKPFQAEIVKEAGEEAADIQLKVFLESGVTLYVCQSGGAEGSDGKTYFPVLREVAEELHGYEDVVAEVIGWSSELSQEEIITLEG